MRKLLALLLTIGCVNSALGEEQDKPAAELAPSAPFSDQSAQMQTFVHSAQHAPALLIAKKVDAAFRQAHEIEIQNDGVVTQAPVVLVPDSATNSLIVTASRQYTEEIKNLIAEADVKPSQYVLKLRIASIGPDGKKSVVATPQLIVPELLPASIEFADHDLGQLSVEVEVAEVSAAGKENDHVANEAQTTGEAEDCISNWILQGYRRFNSPGRTKEEERIAKALDQPISLHFEKAPLKEVIRHISMTSDLNIILDDCGLKEEGITTDWPVTIDVDGIMAKSALNLLLEPNDLAFSIEDEVLKISSQRRLAVEQAIPKSPLGLQKLSLVGHQLWQDPDSEFPLGPALSALAAESGPALATLTVPESDKQCGHDQTNCSLCDLSCESKVAESAEKLIVNVYPVGDLVTLHAEDKAFLRLNTLSEFIKRSVQSESWVTRNGEATIVSFEKTNSMVIRQTEDGHQKIASLLSQVRLLKQLKELDAERAVLDAEETTTLDSE